MKTDLELLELAAKAINGGAWHTLTHEKPWNPLTDDGDALRLAVKLDLDMAFRGADVRVFPMIQTEFCISENRIIDPYAATRRAIVRAAVEIGKTK